VSTPPLSCEFSLLTIPSDSRYAGIAARYAMDVARLIGFDDRMQNQIFEGLQVALPALMTYSFEPQEKAALEVSCERIPAGLKIALRDKGLPFGHVGPASGETGAADKAVLSLRDHFDEIYFNNLGPEGKEVILVKHLGDSALADYEAACRFQPPDASEAMQPLPRPQVPARYGRWNPPMPWTYRKPYTRHTVIHAHDYIYYS
jgi:hypothetical protein